jgi:hypothetical protein
VYQSKNTSVLVQEHLCTSPRKLVYQSKNTSEPVQDH